jgi:hypothetical protein
MPLLPLLDGSPDAVALALSSRQWLASSPDVVDSERQQGANREPFPLSPV